MAGFVLQSAPNGSRATVINILDAAHPKNRRSGLWRRRKCSNRDKAGPPQANVILEDPGAGQFIRRKTAPRAGPYRHWGQESLGVYRATVVAQSPPPALRAALANVSRLKSHGWGRHIGRQSPTQVSCHPAPLCFAPPPMFRLTISSTASTFYSGIRCSFKMGDDSNGPRCDQSARRRGAISVCQRIPRRCDPKRRMRARCMWPSATPPAVSSGRSNPKQPRQSCAPKTPAQPRSKWG